MSFDSKKTRMIAMDVYAGTSQTQIQTINFVNDVAGSLGGKYFLFHDQTGAKHYAWFDAGSSTDPAPAGGWTAHHVVITSGMSATAIAAATVTLLTGVAAFTATSVGSLMTLTNVSPGYAQPARDADLVAKQTGFAFQVVQHGALEEKLGLLEGQVEISGFQADIIEVKAHQTGSTILGEIITGFKKPELSFTMQETDKATVMRVFRWSGQDSFTPVGANAVESFGYGLALIGTSRPQMKFRLHPIAKGTDLSEDWNLWSCTADLDKFAFTSDKIVNIPVKLTAFPDFTKPANCQILFIGDASTVASNPAS